MEVKFDTKRLLVFEEVTSNKTTYYRQFKEDENQEKVKIYEKTGSGFTYYLEGGNSIKEIYFQGYTTLPDIVSQFGFGFEEKSITNFFKFKLENSGYDKLYISDNLPTKKRKKNG